MGLQPVQRTSGGEAAQADKQGTAERSSRIPRDGGYAAQQAALAPQGAVQLMPADGAVQAKGGAELGGDTHAIAARGTQGGGGALPYADQIQQSFGRHDVSGIKAHTGGAAQQAATSNGPSPPWVFGDGLPYSVTQNGLSSTLRRASGGRRPPSESAMLRLGTYQLSESHGRPGKRGCCQ